MNVKELKQRYLDKEFSGGVFVEREYDWPLTGKVDKWNNPEHDYSVTAQVVDKGWKIYLQHSCDEWVIGNIENAKEMKKGLEEVIAYCEANP